MFRYIYIHICTNICGTNYFGCCWNTGQTLYVSTSVCLPHVKPPCRCTGNRYWYAMNEYDVNFVSSLEDTVSIEISTESKFWFLTHFVTSICCLCVNGEVGVFSECSCRTNRVFTLHCIPLLVVEGNNKSSYS